MSDLKIKFHLIYVCDLLMALTEKKLMCQYSHRLLELEGTP